ncbi:MAG: glycosyltransferase [Chlorobi bacterium]|nr:glycosyltransferase [Chlorobiota bacterium]
MKFFSIISICFKNLDELKYTSVSIGSQTCTDFEWIVVDGDSQDGTKDWLSRTNPSKWVSEKDNGIYDAMNKGIEMATGKYLIFMNSGDSFASSSVLEKTKKEVQVNGSPCFVYGDSIDISENNQEFYRKAKSHSKNWLGMITQHQAMFFKTKCVGQKRYSLNYPLSADYAFISEILVGLKEKDVLQLDFPICKFSMGGANEEFRFKAIKEDYSIREKIIKLSIITNLCLLSLHYIHASIKKINPASRFFRHSKQSIKFWFF